MNLKSWGIFLLFLVLLFQIVDNKAQTFHKSYTISWEEPLSFTPDEDYSIQFLHFDGAISSENFPALPLFYDKLPVNNFCTEVTAILQNEKYITLTESELKIIPSDFTNEKVLVSTRGISDRKNDFIEFSFIPIVKRGGGKFEKLISFDVLITAKTMKSKQQKSYAENSVLQYGSWYKFSITQTGIHKVTYQDMVAMGIPVAGLKSENIALFGNGGGMLPEANAKERIDDLRENPIKIFDGGDGYFNENDYLIFYAQSPNTWDYSAINQKFSHHTNIYSDYAYYFINIESGIGSKKRISSVDNSSLIPNQTVSEYTHYNFYEQDTRVLAETGREWFGDAFDINTSRTYSFSLPGYKPNSARVSVSAASAYSGSSLFEVTVNGNSVGRMLLPACTSNKIFGTLSESDFSFTPNAASLTVGLTYNKPSSSAVAYLDWIEIQATCNLSMHSAQFPFCNVEVIGENNIALFSVSNANSATMIWDVTVPTEPVQMMGTLSNHVFQFKTLTQSLKKFVAFNGTQYYSITPIGSVSRQNLHGESMVDMVIVAYPDFMSQAERLAEYRRENNGLSVKVVTPQQVYNEFSSGSQDPTAIRDYMKMIYEKSNKLYPRYLLLFGRPSFDYRERISGNKLFVPNWQNKAVGSINEYAFRANDDYFGILGDADGEGCKGYIEVAIGRFPVVNAAQAKLAVDKSIQYTTSKNLVTNVNSTQISNLADWRNVITFIADDEDHNTHINTADQCAQLVANSNKNINLDKIYCDAYQQVSNSGGQRYPDVNKAINNRMDRGTLYLSYIGHSGVDGWAHERILEFSDINKWTNQYNQPLIMTLSCDFGWYDRKITSPAEVAFFNSKGGSSVMITTSRVAYTSSNDGYARKLFASLFKKENNQYKTVGEINMYAKNEYGGAQSSLNMIYLMGDPSMPLPIPQFKVITDSINGLSIHEKMDTARALSKVTITGRVVDDNGNTLTDFNGNLFPSVFDKKTTVHTLQNDPEQSDPYTFEVQKNVLFKGNSSVKNGRFEFTFIIPKDINYAYGNGKISYYARSNGSDATGYFEDFIIGGNSGSVIADKKGPEIELYMNDESFVYNGLTNPNPVMIAKIKDESGINTTGNGIGHDLVVILDDVTENQMVLNDYYEATQDSFNSGKVRYPFENLAIGKHKLKVRAWDVLNNVSENVLEFTVMSDAKLALDHVLNYPNPFTTHTSFYFEHNQNGETFDIIIQIFTISGKLVKTIEKTQYMEGNRSAPIDWDGRDDFGDKIDKGVYIYKLKVKNQRGEKAEKIEKIVIL